MRLSLLSLFSRRNSSNTAKTAKELKIINSNEVAESPESATRANEKRVKEIRAYQRELARARRSHASYAQSLPTKSQIEKDAKLETSKKREESWERYVEGLKKCWNPPVEELQAAGKIPRRDEAKRAEKARRGQENLMKALKQPILMKRKYLNYLSTEIVPNLVTPDNLDAKIQEAVDGAEVSGAKDTKSRSNAYNVTAETVVECEKEVKRKLKEIRVPI